MNIQLFIETAKRWKRGVSVQVKLPDGSLMNITLLKSSWNQLITHKQKGVI